MSEVETVKHNAGALPDQRLIRPVARAPMRWGLLLVIGLLLAACQPAETSAPLPTDTPARVLATAVISPTPNPDQVRATQAASSPTPAPATPTLDPSPTPYIGVFIGEVERDNSSVNVQEPFFAPAVSIFAQPTANPARCGTPIDPVYVRAWSQTDRVNQALGCPIQVAFGFFGQVQLFEQGIMYRRDETREVWAITSDGEAGRYWYVDQPPQVSVQGMTAPDGLLPPAGDFAVVWLNVAGLRDAIGYARTEPSEIAMGAQRFASGTFLLDGSAGQVYALVIDGRLFGPFPVPEEDDLPIPADGGVTIISTTEPRPVNP